MSGVLVQHEWNQTLANEEAKWLHDLWFEGIFNETLDCMGSSAITRNYIEMVVFQEPLEKELLLGNV